MPFDRLPPQPPINPKADAYGAVALELSRSAAASLRTVLDISYGSHPEQALDLYLPGDVAARNVPVLIHVHGGGWTHGFKEWSGFNALPLVDLPAILVSIGYRLAPGHRMPDLISDAADALAWVWRNIAVFGGDPNRIVLGGHSAGAYLASMVTLQPRLLAERGLPPDAIKACMPASSSHNLDFVENPAGPFGEKVLKHVLASPADGPAMSVKNHVAGNVVPFFVCWGSEDTDRARGRGPEIVALLAREKGRLEHHVFETFDHFEMHIDQLRPENLWVRKARQWLVNPPPRG